MFTMKRLFVLFLSLFLIVGSAAADDPVTSYAAVQDRLLTAAYKVPPFDAVLTGTISAVIPSYSFKNTYYLFVMVDPDDVSMWSTEDDNFFVVIVSSDADPFPFNVGETITVEGTVPSVYSSPVCPYIVPKTINGADSW